MVCAFQGPDPRVNDATLTVLPVLRRNKILVAQHHMIVKGNPAQAFGMTVQNIADPVDIVNGDEA